MVRCGEIGRSLRWALRMVWVSSLLRFEVFTVDLGLLD